jgi:membrane protein
MPRNGQTSCSRAAVNNSRKSFKLTMLQTARTAPRKPQGNRPTLIGLFRRLASDFEELIRQEIALAKAEFRAKLSAMVRHVSEMAVGGTVAVLGLLVFIAFLVVGGGVLLGDRYWLSSLLVALLLLGGGAGLGYLGVRRIGATKMAPAETLQSVRETAQWAGAELTELKANLRGDASGAASVRLDAGARSATKSLDRPRETLPVASVTAGGNAAAVQKQPTQFAPNQLPLTVPLYKRILHEIKDDDVTGQAAKLAYFMFTCLPPALLVLFGITGFVGGGLSEFLAERIQQVLPGTADDPESAAGFLNGFVQDVVTQRAPGPLSIGILTGLWAASAVFVAASDTLNRAFDVTEDRSWFKRRGIAALVMVGFVVLFVAGSLMLIGGPQIADALQLGSVGNLIWSIVQWPLAFAMVVIAFFFVYYLLPNRDQRGCKRELAKASAIAAGLWLFATLAFRIYISNFGSYGETYGFVGAILVLLLWLYLTGMVMLAGGEIASELERKA